VRTPYDNGKIQIGINYKPTPYVETDPDMILLQKSLIQGNKPLFKKYWGVVRVLLLKLFNKA
jgi:hypothetical protein